MIAYELVVVVDAKLVVVRWRDDDGIALTHQNG